jgi:hypothetical protein
MGRGIMGGSAKKIKCVGCDEKSSIRIFCKILTEWGKWKEIKVGYTKVKDLEHEGVYKKHVNS